MKSMFAKFDEVQRFSLYHVHKLLSMHVLILTFDIPTQ